MNNANTAKEAVTPLGCFSLKPIYSSMETPKCSKILSKLARMFKIFFSMLRVQAFQDLDQDCLDVIDFLFHVRLILQKLINFLIHVRLILLQFIEFLPDLMDVLSHIRLIFPEFIEFLLEFIEFFSDVRLILQEFIDFLDHIRVMRIGVGMYTNVHTQFSETVV